MLLQLEAQLIALVLGGPGGSGAGGAFVGGHTSMLARAVSQGC